MDRLCRHCGVRVQAYSNGAGGSFWNHIGAAGERYAFCLDQEPRHSSLLTQAEPYQGEPEKKWSDQDPLRTQMTATLLVGEPFQVSTSTTTFRTLIERAPRIEVTSWVWYDTRRHGPSARRQKPVRHRYAVTLVIQTRLENGGLYTGLYGYSVRQDGVSYGNEHPISFHYGSTVRPISA